MNYRMTGFPPFEEDGREQALREVVRQLGANRDALAIACPALVPDLPFIETSVSRLIFNVIERATRYGQNGLLIGAAGVGKTKTLEEVKRRSDNLEGPSTALIEITGTIGGSTMAVFEELCPYLGVQAATSIAATQRRLMRSACFHPLVIFDEAQHLTLKSIRELLFIAEAARIRMIFCGNSEVLKLVGSAQAAIQQISRRLPIREEITCILDSDADLMANAFGVEGMDAYEHCRALGRAFHADGVVQVLKVARQRLGEKGTIRADHVREAIEFFPHFKAALAKARKVARVVDLTGHRR